MNTLQVSTMDNETIICLSYFFFNSPHRHCLNTPIHKNYGYFIFWTYIYTFYSHYSPIFTKNHTYMSPHTLVKSLLFIYKIIIHDESNPFSTIKIFTNNKPRFLWTEASIIKEENQIINFFRQCVYV